MMMTWCNNDRTPSLSVCLTAALCCTPIDDDDLMQQWSNPVSLCLSLSLPHYTVPPLMMMTWCSNDWTPSISLCLSHCHTILYPLWCLQPPSAPSYNPPPANTLTPAATQPPQPTKVRSRPRCWGRHRSLTPEQLLCHSGRSAFAVCCGDHDGGLQDLFFFSFFFFLHTSFGCWTCCVVRKLESLSPETSSVAWLCCWLFLELFLNNCLSASVQFISSVLIIYTCFCRVTGAFLPLTRHWTPLAPC